MRVTVTFITSLQVTFSLTLIEREDPLIFKAWSCFSFNEEKDDIQD